MKALVLTLTVLLSCSAFAANQQVREEVLDVGNGGGGVPEAAKNLAMVCQSIAKSGYTKNRVVAIENLRFETKPEIGYLTASGVCVIELRE